MKVILYSSLCFLLFGVYAQSESAYSWVECQSSTSFLPSKADQFYQGPCVAYALTAALETKIYKEYGIEYDLSELYTDYLIYNAGRNLGSLNAYMQNIKIPKSNGDNNFPLRPCGDPPRNQTISNIFSANKNIEVVLDLSNEQVCEGIDNILDAGNITQYATVSNVTKRTLSTNHSLRSEIKNGPVIMRVNGSALSTFFNGRSSADATYHAVLIYGWQEKTGSTTKYRVKDSWPGSPNTVITKAISDATLSSLQNTGDLEFATVGTVTKSSGFKSNNCMPTLTSIRVIKDYALISGDNYAKCSVTSNVAVEDWQWEINTSHTRRSFIKQSKSSSIMISPQNSGTYTIKVRAKREGIWTSWRTLTTNLSADGIEWDDGMF